MRRRVQAELSKPTCHPLHVAAGAVVIILLQFAEVRGAAGAGAPCLLCADQNSSGRSSESGVCKNLP